MRDNQSVVLGVDGLSPQDVSEFDRPDDWEELQIETVAHTCPSWNAIFRGRELDGVYDFFKTPEEYEAGDSLPDQSDSMYEYDGLSPDELVWEKYDVDVVSAPVVLPTFSTLDEPPENSLTWPSSREEVMPSIEKLTKMTLEHETVITVLPFPDKIHHMTSPDSTATYTAIDRDQHMNELFRAVEKIIDEFDEWLVLSDHGRPTEAESVLDGLQVPSHQKTGVAKSNVADVSGQTNVTIHDAVVEVIS